jgi:hypothetical protein
LEEKSVKKYCNFCGEPMLPEAKECKQCGWDVSHDAAPTIDPGDRKARIGVTAGLVVAYAVMWTMARSAPAEEMPAPARTPAPAVAEEVAEPIAQPAVEVSTMPAVVASLAAPAARSALISIKVADTKNSTVPAKDALQYAFVLPETDQNCKLVGWTKGVGGFGRNIEVFLLTDDEYVFWHANPVAIAQSSWETFRGSENTLSYSLKSAGTYHFIISNEMSSTPQNIAVKAQVKCAR